MNGKDLQVKKEEIQELGLDSIKDFFKVDISKIDPKLIVLLHSKAKIAMQFEREMSLSKRAVEMNYIRVFRMIAEDKKELKRYVKKSLPQYYPI